jgi:hypothetical protein
MDGDAPVSHRRVEDGVSELVRLDGLETLRIGRHHLDVPPFPELGGHGSNGGLGNVGEQPPVEKDAVQTPRRCPELPSVLDPLVGRIC